LLLYAAVPLLAWFLWWGSKRRNLMLARLGDSDLINRLSRSVNHRGRRIGGVLLLVAAASLVTALARPQFGTRLETVRREGRDVMVAIDVSASMLAEDIAPNRLEKAKHAVTTLIDQLEGDRIGLVAFAGEAFVQTPLTLDYGAALLFLRSMGPDLIPVPGTDLITAMTTALDGFSDEVEQNRILLLITDGEDHSDGVQDVIERSIDEGVVVYTVGMGSPEGVPIPEFDERGRSQGFKRDENGEVVVSRLDEQTLEEIARQTGGRYFRGTAQESEIDDLAEAIAGIESSELATQQFTQFEEQFQVFLGLGLLLLTVEMLIPERRRVKQEWKGRFG
jgi:Ca-activated chloride channel family protein